jgi:asparagine synthetase B (glutamine-hydrolysing)
VILQGLIRPDFLIIGAQRARTTWLWTMLKQYPGTSLPERKEIHFSLAASVKRQMISDVPVGTFPVGGN